MKKNVSVCLLLAMLVSFCVMPAYAARTTTNETDYTATDYTIPFDKFYPDCMIAEEVMEDGKTALKFSADPDEEWPLVLIGENRTESSSDFSNSLHVRLGDYKYLVMKCKWSFDLLPHSPANIPLKFRHTDNTLKSENQNPLGMNAGYFKGQTNELGDLSAFKPIVGYEGWLYVIFDLTKDHNGAAYYENLEAGLDEYIETAWIYFFGNGGFKNEQFGDDCCYLQFATFTNDYDTLITNDKNAKAPDPDEGNQNPDADPGTDTGDSGNGTQEPPANTQENETTNVPADTNPGTEATTADEKNNDKGGCGSVLGGTAVVAFVTALVAGCAVIGKKRRKE